MDHYQIEIGNKLTDVYRFPYEPIASNMFFIPSGNTGIVFDPNENDKLLCAFEKHKTKYITIVLTHEHYDHTNGTSWLQSKIDSKLFCQQECAKSIALTKGNEPKLVALVLASRDAEDGGHRYDDFKASYKRYSLHADYTFDKEYTLNVGHIKLKCFSTPGHSPGSAIYILEDKYVFTGDSLLQNTPAILRFPKSDAKIYEEVTLPFLNSLDKNMLAFPGHGEPFKIVEAKTL